MSPAAARRGPHGGRPCRRLARRPRGRSAPRSPPLLAAAPPATRRHRSRLAVPPGRGRPVDADAASSRAPGGWPAAGPRSSAASTAASCGSARRTGGWPRTPPRRSYFVLPDSMPRTSARAAWVDWRFSPQSASTNPAFLSMTASGARLLTAVPGEAPSRAASCPHGSRGLELSVWCSPVNGPGWCNWPGPLLGVHGFTVELEEAGEPAASATGPLLEPRPQSGIEPLAIARLRRRHRRPPRRGHARRRRGRRRSSPPTAAATTACRRARRALRGTIDVDTRLVPDGARRLRLVVTDAAGNARTVEAGDRAGRQPAARADAARARARRRLRRGRHARAGRDAGARRPSHRRWPRRGRSRRTRSPAAATCANGRGATDGRTAHAPGSSPAATARARRCGAAPRRSRTGVRVRIRGRLTGRARPRHRPGDARRHPPRARPAVAGGDRRPDPPGRPLHRVHPDRPVAGAPVRLLRLRRLAPRPASPTLRVRVAADAGRAPLLGAARGARRRGNGSLRGGFGRLEVEPLRHRPVNDSTCARTTSRPPYPAPLPSTALRRGAAPARHRGPLEWAPVIARPPLPPGPFLVVGLARSGVAAALALRGRGAEVDRGRLRAAWRRGRRAAAAPPASTVHARRRRASSCSAGTGSVIKSPGVPQEAPVVAAARERGIPVLGELETGWRLLPEHEFIAVTGSNGKTTTVELIGHLHREAGLPVKVAGNVGTALTALPGTLAPGTIVVARGVLVPARGHGGVRARGRGAAQPRRGPPRPPRHVRGLPRRQARDLRPPAERGASRSRRSGLGRRGPRRLRAARVLRRRPGRRARRPRRPAVVGRASRCSPSPRSACAAPTTSRTRWRPPPSASRAASTPRRSAPGCARSRGVPHRLEEVATVDGVLYVNDSKATNVASARGRDRLVPRRRARDPRRPQQGRRTSRGSRPPSPSAAAPRT